MSEKFHCDLCNKDVFYLQQHHEAVHLNLRQYQCKKCDKTFNDPAPLRKHIKVHEAGDTRNHECDVCKKSFKTNDQLRAHIKRSHVMKSIKCQYCEKISKNKYQLKSHEEAHFANINCDECDRSFHRKAEVREHKKLFHTPDLPRVNCDQCDSSFKAIQYLRKHMKYRHSDKDAKRWICEVCHKNYSGHGALAIHKLTHGEKLFKCDFCVAMFAQPYALKAHIKRVHLKVKTHKCSTCEKSFVSKHSLRGHELSHSGEMPYECAKCNMKIRNQSNWKRHEQKCMREEKENNKFNCTLCPKMFIGEKQLSNHLLYHNEEPKYKCDICNKTYKLSSSLRRHEKGHVR